VIEIPTGGGVVVTVTVAAALFVLSAELVAFTVYEPAVLGAVYRPDVEIVPPEADQLTAVLLVPVTVAVNCCVVPVCSAGELGIIETEIAGDPVVTVTVAVPD